MLDRETKREIAQVVNEAIRNALKPYNEEWVTEQELCKRIHLFTPGIMRRCRAYLPQTVATYRDNLGVHETRRVYGLHAIQEMILNDDLDFARPDRAVYRISKKTKK